MQLQQPNSCIGCPFYGNSEGFVPDRMIPESEILILGQNPGINEINGKKVVGKEWCNGKPEEITRDVTPEPFIGSTGKWIRDEFWPLAKLGSWENVSTANAIKCMWKGKTELPNIASRELRDAILHCTNSHLRIPDSVRYILVLGQIPLWATTRQISIREWRGYALGAHKESKHVLGVEDYYDPVRGNNRLYNIMPSLHPASLFKDTKLHHAVLSDFAKFGKFVKGEWPKRTPEIIRTMPKEFPQVFGFDTEYDVSDNNRLIMWSMADLHGHVYTVDASDTDSLGNLGDTKTVITQNGLVDIPHLAKIMDISGINLEDTMLAHAVLWTGEPHSLDYMCSIYGKYNRHKHLSENDPHFYAGLDADTTINHVWLGMLEEFKKDKLSWENYVASKKRLLPIINKAQLVGIPTDQSRIQVVANIYRQQMEQTLAEARVLTNNPKFKLSSVPQLAEALYGDE